MRRLRIQFECAQVLQGDRFRKPQFRPSAFAHRLRRKKKDSMICARFLRGNTRPTVRDRQYDPGMGQSHLQFHPRILSRPTSSSSASRRRWRSTWRIGASRQLMTSSGSAEQTGRYYVSGSRPPRGQKRRVQRGAESGIVRRSNRQPSIPAVYVNEHYAPSLLRPKAPHSYAETASA